MSFELFADWGVIVDSARNGEYSPAFRYKSQTQVCPYGFWKLRLFQRRKELPTFESLVNGPCMFPFQFDRVVPEQLAESGRWKLSAMAWKRPSSVSASQLPGQTLKPTTNSI